ncbi:unnamed protein product [Rotaria socialis]
MNISQTTMLSNEIQMRLKPLDIYSLSWNISSTFDFLNQFKLHFNYQSQQSKSAKLHKNLHSLYYELSTFESFQAINLKLIIHEIYDAIKSTLSA